MKTVLVIMSTYNGEKYLREQIESIITQNGDFKLDILVRDDGSTDETQKILEEYQESGVLSWYTGENLRSAKSFMHLIKASNAYDYYVLADQDDVWASQKIGDSIQCLEKHSQPALYFSNAELVDSNMCSLNKKVYQHVPKTDFETLCCAGGVLGCTVTFNKALANEIKNRNLPQNVVMHDFYLAIVCLALGGVIEYSDKAYVKYRQHSNNVVGVSYGVIGTICGRLKDITTKMVPGIAEQANEILLLYSENISEEKRQWLEVVSQYKKSIYHRVKLAFSTKTKYISKNMGIKLRVSILLGNR